MEDLNEDVNKIKRRFINNITEGDYGLVGRLSVPQQKTFIDYLSEIEYEDRLTILTCIIDSYDEDTYNNTTKNILLNFRKELMEISRRA